MTNIPTIINSLSNEFKTWKETSHSKVRHEVDSHEEIRKSTVKDCVTAENYINAYEPMKGPKRNSVGYFQRYKTYFYGL